MRTLLTPQVYIIDPDPVAEPSIGGAPLEFTVRLTELSQTPTIVNYSTQDGSAKAGTNYTPGAGQVTIPANTIEAKFVIEVLQDSTESQNIKDFFVKISGASGANVSNANTARGAIDDLTTLFPGFTTGLLFNPVTIIEGDTGKAQLSLSASVSDTSKLTSDLKLNISATDITATLGSDYSVATSSVTFTLNGPSTQSFVIDIQGDKLYEQDELLELHINPLDPSVSNGFLRKRQHFLTIANDDAPAFTVSSPSVNEGSAAAPQTLTFSVTPPPNFPGGQVSYYTEGITATDTIDYIGTSGVLNFAQNSTTAQAVSVQVVGDGAVANDETFKLVVTGGSPATSSFGIGTILNDDDLKLAIGDASTNESSPLPFTVSYVNTTEPGYTTPSVSVKYYTDNGSGSTPASTADFGAIASSPGSLLTIPAGASSASFSISIINDTLYEGATPETFTAFLGAVTSTGAAASVFDSSGIGSIVDDDPPPPPTLGFDASSYSIVEGTNGTKTLTAKVVMSPPQGSAVNFYYSTSDLSATSGEDYTGVSSQPASIPAFAPYINLSIPITTDHIDEPDQQFKITLSPPSGVQLSSNSTATVTILNDDPLFVSIAPGSSVNEGDSGKQTKMSFTVSLNTNANPPFRDPVTVNYSTKDGTATATAADSDYVPIFGQLTFSPGQPSQTIDVLINGDSTIEANETFTVELTSPIGAELDSSRDKSTGTILDDDAPFVKITAPDSQAFERWTTSQRTGIFRISRESASGTPITSGNLVVPFSLSGDATYVVDYFITPSSSVTIPNGSSFVDVTVKGVPDFENSEGTETVTALITPVPGVFSVATGFVAADIDILNVVPPQVKIEAIDKFAYEQATLSNGTLGPVAGKFRISLVDSLGASTSIPFPVDVQLSVLSNTDLGIATLTTDYTLSQTIGTSPTVLTILGGATGLDIVVNPIADNISESPEAVTLTVNAVGSGVGNATNNNATLGTPTSATVTIKDSGFLVSVLSGGRTSKTVPLGQCGCSSGGDEGGGSYGGAGGGSTNGSNTSGLGDVSLPSSQLSNPSLRFDDSAADPRAPILGQTTLGVAPTGQLPGAPLGTTIPNDMVPVSQTLGISLVNPTTNQTVQSQGASFSIPAGTASGATLRMGALVGLNNAQQASQPYPTALYKMRLSTATVWRSVSQPSIEVIDNEQVAEKDYIMFTRPGRVALSTVGDGRFGQGWSLPGLKQVFPQNNSQGQLLGVALSTGNGEAYWYAKGSGSTFIRPVGIFSDLSKDANGQYFLTDSNFITSYFNTNNGLIEREVDRNGNTTNYVYNAQGQLTSITDAWGNAVVVTYNANNDVTSYKNADGITYEFGYVTYGSGSSARSRLSFIESPDPDTTSTANEPLRTYYTYDAAGRMTREEVRKYPYTDTGLTGDAMSKTDYTISSKGYVSKMILQDQATPDNPTVPATWNFEPAWASSKFLETDVNVSNKPGNLMDGLDIRNMTVSPTNEITYTDYTWDNRVFRQTDVTTVGGVTTEETTTFTYTGDGLVKSIEYPPVPNSPIYAPNLTIGNQTLKIEFTYDNGHPTSTKVLSNGIPDGEQTSTATYFGTYGDVFQSYDELGRYSWSKLDGKGNLSQVTGPDPDGTGPQVAPVTAFQYDAKGLITQMLEADPDAAGPKLSPKTTYEYTADGKIDKILRYTSATAYIYDDYIYDANGNLSRIQQDASGVANTVSRDLVSFGNYTNGSGGYINEFKLPGYVESDGRRLTYKYDAMGHVLEVVQGTAVPNLLTDAKTSYEYDGRGRLKKFIEPTVTVYNAAFVSTPSFQPTTIYAYRYDGQIASITDPSGTVTTFIYDGDGHRTGELYPVSATESIKVTYTYDARDRVVSETVARVISGVTQSPTASTTYGYDGLGRLLQVTDLIRGATTSYTYDKVSNRTSVTDAEGRVESYVYNDLDLLTDVNQPAFTNPNPFTVAGSPSTPLPDDPAVSPNTHMTYDGTGRLVEVRDPRLNVTTYDYDMLSRVAKVEWPQPAGLTRPSETYGYDSLGRTLTVTDQVARVTTYEYNNSDQVTKITSPSPGVAGSGPLVQTYHYDQFGRMDYSVAPRNNAASPPTGTTFYYWNNRGQLERVIAPNPSTGGSSSSGFNPEGQTLPNPQQWFYYDKNGDLIHEKQLSPFAYGSLNAPTLEYVRTSYGLDLQGRVITITSPQAEDGQPAVTQSMTYDALGRTLSSNDALNRTTNVSYDDANGIVTVLQPSLTGSTPPPGSDGDRPKTITKYDKVGNMTSLTAPSGNETKYSYNALDLRSKETDSYGNVIFYGYDVAGNLVSKYGRSLKSSTGKRVEREYQYDALNRLTNEVWRGSTAATSPFHEVTYEFDSAGNLDKVSESHGGTTSDRVAYDYAYDKLGRLTQVVDTANYAGSQNGVTVNQVPATLNYTYAATGDLQFVESRVKIYGQTTDGQDSVQKYWRDNLGRVTSVEQYRDNPGNTTGLTTNILKWVVLNYRSDGQLGQVKRYENSATDFDKSTYTYSHSGALKSIQNRKFSGGVYSAYSYGPSANQDYTWTYDAVGRVQSFQAPEGQLDYAYDGVDQLKSSTFTVVAPDYTGAQPATENFTFNLNGNRTNWTYDDDRLTNNGESTFVYDSEGNTTTEVLNSDNSKEISTWDLRERLTRVTFKTAADVTTKTIDFTYDPFNRLVMKQADRNADGTFEATERYVYDGDQVTMVLDENGVVKRRYLTADEIDMVFAEESTANAVLWYLQDNQGTVRDVVNKNGQVVNHVAYSAFGEIVGESDPAKTPFLAYTGQILDEDIQAQSHLNRWYDPHLGRWKSEDPIREGAGDTNFYRYVGNNPTNSIDPSGLEVQKPIRQGRKVIIHVYAPDGWFENGDRIGTVVADLEDQEEALVKAHQLYKAHSAEKIRKIVVDAVAQGIDIGLRVALDPVDNLGSALEFIDKPSIGTAAGMLPLVPSTAKRLGDAAQAVRHGDDVCPPASQSIGRNPKGSSPGDMAVLRKELDAPSTFKPGSFSVRDWAGYPSGAPKPTGPFRLLTGAEYYAARKAADEANAALRRADPAKYAGKQIHEIQPVKFGGSPTDPANKIALDPVTHRQFNAWWYKLQKSLE